ncbi:MAG: glycosyltransferase [Phycisphaerae bacterium]|nr:glycosyltransferase [Phycisphaerae bacterium]
MATRPRHGATTESVRIAVYADINLNVIDGSAIWLTSIVEALSGFDQVSVTVYLKAAERRDLLTSSMKVWPGVRLIFPTTGPDRPTGVLTADNALDAILTDDLLESYSAIVIRGFEVSALAAARPRLRGRLWTYLTDLPRTEEEMTAQDEAVLDDVAAASEYMQCQTEELRSWIEANSPSSRHRCVLLPPMIPAPPQRRSSADILATTKRIVYSGKFAPPWKPLEMVSIFERARRRYPELELHVFGDKIHDPPELPTFRGDVERALATTDGLIWHRGLTRAQVVERLADMDLAWAWRSAELEDVTLELSTKVLEYGSAGLPVLVARNEINERCLGRDYPLFANSEDEVFDLLLAMGSSPEEFRRAADRTKAASRAFTFEAVRKASLDTAVRGLKERAHIARRQTHWQTSCQWHRPDGRSIGIDPQASGQHAVFAGRNLLFAGHDLRLIYRFMTFLDRVSGITIIEDNWRERDVHDEQQSTACLSQANTIFCESCTDHALWYARRKRPHQRLVIRFHAQDLHTPFPERLKIEAVDRIICVSEHLRRAVVASFGWPTRKLAVVPHYVDLADFDRPKLPGAPFNLGLVGLCPGGERLEDALTILEQVLRHDRRFMLYVKGALPWEDPGLWARPDERSTYEDLFWRIRSSETLSRHVVFDSKETAVAAWLRKIGHVLSPHDSERFYWAPVEGAASGALPRIIEMNGAAEVFHPDWVDRSPAEAAARILDSVHPDVYPNASAFAQFLVRERYGTTLVFKQLNEVILDPS